MKNLPWAGNTVCWCTNTIALMVLFLPVSLMASPFFQLDDQHLVTGTVTDESGLPLPGVNIIIKNTQNGTMSDAEGKYSLHVSATDRLTFSYVGFKKVEIPVDGKEVLNVQLEEDVAALDEVVVNAGYYTVKEKERTGNISRITSKDIEKQPVANPLQALAGRMPGVQVTQQSGVPGGGFTVRVRGQNSLRTDLGVNDPLYIIDGVPFPSTPLNPRGISHTLPNSINPFNSINPSDIESIEVLKDADATAIYGSRGANGVILITTKKGKTGKSRVDINLYSGTGNVARTMDLLNTKQYLAMRYEALTNDGAEDLLENPAFDRPLADLKFWGANRYTDWQKELIGGTAYYNNAQVSLSGGNANTRYRAGGGYFRQTTVYPGNHGDTRISGHISFSHTTPNKRFQATLNASYTSNVINILSEDLTRQAVTLPPNAPPLYDNYGRFNWENSSWTNPLAYLEQEYEGITDHFVASAMLDYQLIPGLHVSSQLGYTNMQVREVQIEPLSTVAPAFRPGRTGLSIFSNSYRKTWIVEPQITYKKNIGHGVFHVLIGGTFQQNTGEKQQITAIGYANDALLKDLRAAPLIRINQSGYTQYRYHAVFGRINYNWKEKYIINLTGRRDGSSRFGPGKQFASFGAIGMAWIFSNELFLKGTFVSFGKLRGSFGTTGSDAIGDYGYLDTYSSTDYPYQEQAGLIPTRLANPGYGWETNKKLELALELGFMEDRIFISGNWYRNRSSDQLVGFPLPVTTGQSTIQYNLPATVENKGWELVLNTINARTKHFSWTTAFNISFPKNKLLEYEHIEASPFAHKYRVGQSLFIAPGFHFLNVNPETGLYAFKDIDGNGRGTDYPADLQFDREIAQKYYGGVQNTIAYRGFELDIFLQFVKQTGRSYFGNSTFNFPGAQSNQPVKVMERWQQEGDITDIQKFSISSEAGQSHNFYRQSDGSIEDASYVRLANVSLSWDLPKELGLANNSKIYLRGQNLFTLTNYKGLDPETQNSSRLPPLRVLTLGIQLGF